MTFDEFEHLGVRVPVPRHLSDADLKHFIREVERRIQDAIKDRANRELLGNGDPNNPPRGLLNQDKP